MFKVAGYSYVGLRKKTNQDSCCAKVAMTPYGETALLAVCDGVGGLSAGEIASYSAIQWLGQWFETVYPALLEALHGDIDSLFDRAQVDLESGLLHLNQALRAYGRTSGAELGTTFTSILFFGNRFLVCHVGDCRVYRFPGPDDIEIITDDQTWVAREVTRGNITPEQARSHPKKNIILQSVGTQKELQPVFSRGVYAQGDVYMVCCDGFRNELFDDELIGAFGSLGKASEKDLYEACASIADIAMARNELDNITAVAMSCQEGLDYDLSKQVDKAMRTTPIVISYEEGDSDASEPTTNLDEPYVYADAHPDLDVFSDMTTVLNDEGGE